jgi:hypothetical protein
MQQGAIFKKKKKTLWIQDMILLTQNTITPRPHIGPYHHQIHALYILKESCKFPLEHK